MEIAVIGNDDFITGFQLAGVQKVFLLDEKNLDSAVEQAIASEGVGVIVMEEEDVQALRGKTRKALDRLVTPVVVTLSLKGKEEDLRKAIKRTVGVDLWK